LDIGGTNLRVVLVELSQGAQVSTRQKKYAIDPLLKVGEPKLLFGRSYAFSFVPLFTFFSSHFVFACTSPF
jgi:hypothetical protein